MSCWCDGAVGAGMPTDWFPAESGVPMLPTPGHQKFACVNDMPWHHGLSTGSGSSTCPATMSLHSALIKAELLASTWTNDTSDRQNASGAPCVHTSSIWQA